MVNLVIDNLNTKLYNIPINVSKATKHKYMEVINKDYSKYLEAIALSGGFCMYKQFGMLISTFNKHKDLSDGTMSVYTSSMVKNLETLGFIGTSFLNRNKYVYLKHPTFALIDGDYNTSRRLILKNELKINKFTTNIIKMEYLINYDECFPKDILDKQLLWITKIGRASCRERV